jgi:cobalt-zinc-cadmium efflux system outer membrane protein
VSAGSFLVGLFIGPASPPAASAPAASVLVAPDGELSLEDALGLTSRQHAWLAVSQSELSARGALASQAGRRPNPELDVALEDFGGTGPLSGFDSSELTFTLSQLLELGGDRGARQRVAEIDVQLADKDLASQRNALMAAARQAFVEVLAAQEQVALATNLVQVASDIHAAVQQRVQAGGASPVEAGRAHVALASSEIDLGQAERELNAARRRLAGFWDGANPALPRALGTLSVDTLVVPELDSLFARAGQNPDVTRWNDEAEKWRATSALARAERRADVRLGAGVRILGGEDAGFVAGLSLPIPVLDRRTDLMRSAETRTAQAADGARATTIDIRSEIGAAHQALAAARDEILTLRDTTLPEAERVFELAQTAHGRGQLRLTDVLDTQRMLFELRGRLVRALARYRTATADLDRLTAQPIGGSR